MNYNTQLNEAYNSEAIQQINNEHQQLFRHLAVNTGQDFNTITDVEFLYNTLEIEEMESLPLPEWTQSVYPEPMLWIAKRSLAIFTETQSLKRLKAGPFLNDLISHLTNSTYKMVLYSGHDITIVNVLQALGFEGLLKPGFGASLVFELHQVKGERIVKVSPK